MKAKAIIDRMRGGPGVDTAPPVDETEAALAAKGLRLKQLLGGAAAESGQLVRTLYELQNVRHVLASRRIKSRLAGGMPEGRARRVVEEELDSQEDLVAALTAETRGLAEQRAAAQARQVAAVFARTAADMTALNAEMHHGPELGAFLAWLRPFHARALKIREQLIEASGNSAARIPDSAPYRGLREWTLGELAAKVVTAVDERKETI